MWALQVIVTLICVTSVHASTTSADTIQPRRIFKKLPHTDNFLIKRGTTAPTMAARVVSKRNLDRRQSPSPSPPSSPGQNRATRRKPQRSSPDWDPSSEVTVPGADRRAMGRMRGGKSPGGARGGVSKTTGRKASRSPPRLPSKPRSSTRSPASSSDAAEPPSPALAARIAALRVQNPNHFAPALNKLSEKPPPSAARLAADEFHSRSRKRVKATSITEGYAITHKAQDTKRRGLWEIQPAVNIHHASSTFGAGLKHETSGPGSMTVESPHSIGYRLKSNPDSQGGQVHWQVPGYGVSKYNVPPGSESENYLDNDSGQPFTLDMSHTGGSAEVYGWTKTPPSSPKSKPR
ncbi:MAG: hypothetical protein GOMPHAMPRED_004474 [Gomphillus americanus]|uniref:Secreted protein n=1 Tax=Gomphillus americanus TaxID=1940652 RepID=A0A8H3FMB2_9LECA|nr:MAG: hypothetical protein GOMPHAMPRED_004474 [Gomphillus americanus]